ncbi:MAG TPA: ComEC/Rec2 family competence protein [Candidatus Paceibacterota bacterium]
MGSPFASNGAGIFWAVVGGFLLGVAGGSFFPLGHVFAAFFVLIGCAGGAYAYFDIPARPNDFGHSGRSKRRQGMVFFVALLAVAAGIIRMDMAALSGDPILTAHLNEQMLIEGVVAAEPDVRDNSVRITIDARHLTTSSTSTKVAVGVLAILPAHADVAYGDVVRAFGTLREPEAFDTGIGRQFAYPQYLAAQGITYQLSLAQAEKKQGAAWAGNPVRAGAIWVKGTFLRGIAAALPEPEAGLSGGITVGDKRSIGKSLAADFQHVGLIHVVVLSGYNITLVLNALAWLLQRAPRLLQWSAAGSVVAFFILMSGGAASATRAGLMALVVILAKATGRTFLAGRALASVALILVAWNPFVLAFDPSFQLSVLATLGLVLFGPLFAERLLWIPEKFALREIASSTLGTQLAVLPILLYQNGQLAIYALPANLFALIAVPWAMLLSLAAGICGALFGSLAVPLAFPAYILLAYIIGIGKFFASLPFADLSVGAFSAWWMIGAYAAIFGGAWYLHPKIEAPR